MHGFMIKVYGKIAHELKFVVHLNDSIIPNLFDFLKNFNVH